jgi:hypothetical protein
MQPSPSSQPAAQAQSVTEGEHILRSRAVEIEHGVQAIASKINEA